MHGIRITCEALPAGVNLRQAMSTALAQYAQQGWQPEGDGAYGFVFIAKGTERRLLNVTPANPFECIGAGHAFLARPGVVTQLVT